jgi:5'-3' exonuclease
MLKNQPLILANMIDKPADTIKSYYKKYFDIDNYTFIINKDDIIPINEELNDVIRSYLEGLLWTFNYYYNESNNISTWFYKYEKAPILRDIYIYIYNNPNSLREIYNKLKKYNVDPSNFFNETELLMYITPYIIENEPIVPKKFLNFFKTDQYYIDNDVYKIVNNLKDYIDCTGARFLNKCTILSLKKYDTSYDMQFIERLREIH